MLFLSGGLPGSFIVFMFTRYSNNPRIRTYNLASQPDRQNRLRFVYTHFKSCGQSLDKTSFDFSDKFHAMQSCAMNAKSSIMPKLPMGMVI